MSEAKYLTKYVRTINKLLISNVKIWSNNGKKIDFWPKYV